MMYYVLEMWWLIGIATDFWGRGPGFAGISHNDPDALQDPCEILQKSSGQRGRPTSEAKKRRKKERKNIMYVEKLDYQVS